MQIDQFTSALDEGVGVGAFGGEDAARGLEVSTVRHWLFLLGYLRRDNEKRVPDEDFREALGRFQQDAGLRSERGVLDGDTLAALTDLVSFDSGTEPDARFDRVPVTSPAWLRAFALRLYALDLIERLPGRQLKTKIIEKGLERFARVYGLLELGTLVPEPTRETLNALYSSEVVLARLRAEKTSLTIQHRDDDGATQRTANKELVKRYVNAVARIELWLIGYLVRPRKHIWARDRSNPTLAAALRAFWRDQPEAERPPVGERDRLTGRFFDRVQAVSEGTDDAHENDEAIRERLLEDAELARAVRRATSSLGARILDGVRRVARFVFGWIRKRIGGIIALARNIASVLANRASAIFRTIQHIVLGVRDSWRFLTGKPVPGSEPEALIVLHDKDFDFVLVGRKDASPTRVLETSRMLVKSARLLNLCARFLQRLVALFATVVRRSGLGGWFGTLLAMLKIRDHLGEIGELVARIVEQRKRLSLSGSTEPVTPSGPA